MSLNKPRTMASRDAVKTETPTIPIGSNKVCDAPSSESDSESESGRGKATGALEASAETIARFWSKVNRNGPVPLHRPELGACWVWTGSTAKGYGQFVLPRDLYGKQAHVAAHRFAYELTHGPVSATAPHICHHCDRMTCCRVSHLFAGTQADNLQDARAKGRLIDGLAARKLSDAAYLHILSEPRDRGTGIALAKKYGVSEITISRIRNGHQGSTYRNAHMIGNVKRVPFVHLLIRGEVA